MAEWPVVPLMEALDFKEGPGILAKDFRAQGTPLIRLAGVKNSAHILDGCNYLDSQMVDQRWSKFRLLTGDVLLSTSASLGEVAVVTPEGEGAVPYTGLIRFRPAHAGVAPDYIPIALRSPSFKTQIAAMGVGSVMKHFGPLHLRKMTIELPPLREQQAIADVLGALDDKIAANTRVIDLLDQLGTAKVRRHATGALVALSSIAVINMGSSPPGTDLSDVPTGIPFYQGVRDFGKRFPGFRVWTEKPVRIAEAGDTLLSVRAPVGRTNLARVRSCIGRGVASLRSTTGTPFTLFHLLATSESAWLPFESEGTVFGSINRKQLGAVLVPTIESSVQTRLESCLASFESQIAATIAANERLAATRDALLPALMSGKLRIKDAERVVSDAV